MKKKEITSVYAYFEVFRICTFHFFSVYNPNFFYKGIFFEITKMQKQAYTIAKKPRSTPKILSSMSAPSSPVQKNKAANFKLSMPIEDLFKNAYEKFKIIKKYYSQEASEEQQENKTQNISRDISNFLNVYAKFVQDLRQLFKSFILNNEKNEIPEKIEEQLINLESLINEVKKLQIILIQKTCETIQKPSFDLSSVNKFNETAESCDNIFVNNVWKMSNFAIKKKRFDAFSKIISHFEERLKNIDNEMSLASKEVITKVHSIEYQEQDNESLQDEDIIYIKSNELQIEACKVLGNILTPLLLKESQNYFPPLRTYWSQPSIHEEKSDDGNSSLNEETTEYINKLRFPLELFNTRFQHLQTLYSYLQRLKAEEDPREEEEEEEEDDLEDDMEPFSPLIPLVQTALTNGYNDLLDATRCLWALSAKMVRSEVQQEYGTLMIQILETRIKQKDETLSVYIVAKIFQDSIIVRDKNIANALFEILQGLVRKRLNLLTKLRKKEILFISQEVQKSFNDQSSNQNIDDFEPIKKSLTNKYRIKNVHLKDISTTITDALRTCQEIALLIRQDMSILPNTYSSETHSTANTDNLQNENNQENEYNESLQENVAVFSKLDLEFNDMAYGHLTNLKNCVVEVYANVLVNQNPSMKDETLSQDLRSVASSSARKAARSKVTRKKMEQNLSYEEKIEVQFYQESIVRTYEELFTNCKSLIRAAIRNLNADTAEKLNKEMRSMNTDYLVILEELRKSCVEDMDIQGTRKIEEKMTNSQVDTNQLIIKCLEESLSDIVEQTIDNYNINVKAIEEDFNSYKSVCEQGFQKRFQELERNEHKPSLELLDKKLQLDLSKEEHRAVSSLTDRKLLIKKLLNARDYAGAQREKKLLDAEIQKQQEQRKKAVTQKYEKLKKRKLEQQFDSLKNLENKYNTKAEIFNLGTEKSLQEQKNILSSSLKSSQQRILLFGTRLLQNDPKVRKDLSKKFLNIVNQKLKNYKLFDLIQPTK